MAAFESERLIKDRLLVFGYIRYIVSIQNPPNDLINLCITFYHIKYNILKWSRELNNNSFIFKDNDKCVETYKFNDNSIYGWIQPNILPIYKGIACWRIKVKFIYVIIFYSKFK